MTAPRDKFPRVGTKFCYAMSRYAYEDYPSLARATAVAALDRASARNRVRFGVMTTQVLDDTVEWWTEVVEVLPK